MRILWITNTRFPATCHKFGLPSPNTGGWIFSLAQELIKKDWITLEVATVYDGRDYQSFKEDKILYHLLPKGKSITRYDTSLEVYWPQIIEKLHPNLIHIHGTECGPGLSCMHSLPDQRYVISIQGLVSVCSDFYYAGLKATEISKHITFRDLLRMDTIFHGKKKFENRGILEREYIKRSKHIVGRTSWDYAHVKAINPQVEYHFCNEILRERFYDSSKWDIDHKVSFSIFLSQAIYPIKGLHQVLKAISILKEFFPDVQLRVAGEDVSKSNNWIEKTKITGYGAYIKALINELNISELVTFTGPLVEEQMVIEYKRAHVFVCPSSIENSPNSLAEAQIIGTPCVGSYVGGVPDMIKDEESGLLYRFEDYVMLAYQIQRIFCSKDLAIKLSERGCDAAKKRHDRDTNTKSLIQIYNDLMK